MVLGSDSSGTGGDRVHIVAEVLRTDGPVGGGGRGTRPCPPSPRVEIGDGGQDQTGSCTVEVSRLFWNFVSVSRSGLTLQSPFFRVLSQIRSGQILLRLRPCIHRKIPPV